MDSADPGHPALVLEAKADRGLARVVTGQKSKVDPRRGRSGSRYAETTSSSDHFSLRKTH